MLIVYALRIQSLLPDSLQILATVSQEFAYHNLTKSHVFCY